MGQPFDRTKFFLTRIFLHAKSILKIYYKYFCDISLKGGKEDLEEDEE
jgi:hypothetical protein